MPSPVLPCVADANAPGAMRLADALFAPALTVLSQRHAVSLAHATRAATGSSPVFLTDTLAVKLVPPQWCAELEREVLAMARVSGRLPVRTPDVVATGELDGWRYLVSERLPGVSAREVHTTLNDRERVALGRAVGEVLAALHRVPCDDLPALAVDWNAFAQERAGACVDLQLRHGFEAHALASWPMLLAEAAPLVPDARRALLHADLHYEHVLLEQRGGAWTLTGVLDFGDAVRGHPEYDLITPVFLVVGAHREALRALFEAAGFRCDERTSRRMMAWSVMHRFNALTRYLPTPRSPDALTILRERYWPVLDG